MIERDVSPSATDPALTANLSDHFVVTPGGASAENRLFVMLPGTTAVPGFYRAIVRTGGEEGYHAIGLTYPNDEAVAILCNGDADPDCAGKARREIITGEALSPLVDVAPANSINGRLNSLLTYLHATYPAEGWDQFQIAGQPNWGRITVAGHSQGAGHAAYFGKLYSMDRIAMFSGPPDVGLTAIQPAQWMSLPDITPPARSFGFTHTADPLVPVLLATTNWSRLGLSAFGPVTSVDGASAPYGSTRQLSTSAPPRPGSGDNTAADHSSPIVDAVTPVDANGVPVYRPVWVYMAFP